MKTNHKRARKKDIPETIRNVEEAQALCPRRHRLPHTTANGQCTPLYCADEGGSRSSTSKKASKVREATKKVREAISKNADSHLSHVLQADEALVASKEAAVEGKTEETVRIGRAAGRYAARQSVVPVPAGLTGAAAEEYADKRLVEMLPLAVAEIEYQLKYGDDAQRDKAAERVLNANGRGKRENQQAQAPTIILQMGNGDVQQNVPWIKRSPAKVLAAEAKNEGDS